MLSLCLNSLSISVSPIIPFTAQEIYEHTQERNNELIFHHEWPTLNNEWYQPNLEKQMKNILHMRDAALKMLETARKDKHIGTSNEAKLNIVVNRNNGLFYNQFINFLEGKYF